VAVGTAPLSYQWTFDGTNLIGATNTSLILASVQSDQAGTYAVVVTNLYGSMTSSNATLAVGFAPSITTQPTSQTNVAGTTATFTVLASGSTPLYYQWLDGGTNLPGANGANLVIADVQTNNAGVYWVVVTNVFGSATSSNATLTVLSPPVILIQPTNQTVVVSNTISFSVMAAGTSPLNYQWSFDGTNLVGATNAMLTLTDVQFAQAGNYSVLVTNLYGSIPSSNAVLTVNPPSCDPAPSGLVSWWPAEDNANDIVGTNNGILEGGASFGPGEVGQAFSFNNTNADVRIPASASLNVGTNNGFTVEAWVNPADVSKLHPLFEWNNGSGAFGVQFYISVDSGPGSFYANIVDSGGDWHQFHSSVAPVTTNVFQHVALTYNKTSGVATIYRNGTMVVQTTVGSFTPLTSYNLYLGRNPSGFSFAGLVDEAALYHRALSSNEIAAIYDVGSGGKCPLPPTILAQPTNQTVMAGATAAFSVKANGSAPLFYQWTFNGTNLLGATNTLLTLANVQPAQAGAYAVQIANAAGSTNSTSAILTVNGAPVITTQPVSQTNFVGGTAVFAVTAIGSTPLSYQWTFNGTNLLVATNSTLALTNLQFCQAGNYTLLVTNLYGAAMSSNALLVINPFFHFVWNAIPSPRFAGAPFAVTVQAQNPTNGLAANFTGTVVLLTTNGMPVSPAVSGNFSQGAWTGTVAITQTGTNLVLEASDAYGENGLANPINIVNLPPLAMTPSGSTLYMTWPVDPTGFVLETSPDLSPGSWAPVSTQPVKILGDQYYLQPITMTGTNAFYRLRFTGQ
jgi:hypothetical protein